VKKKVGSALAADTERLPWSTGLKIAQNLYGFKELVTDQYTFTIA